MKCINKSEHGVIEVFELYSFSSTYFLASHTETALPILKSLLILRSSEIS